MIDLLSSLPGAVAQGLIWGIMAVGVYITYKLLDIADLTVDGSICTGAAVCTMMLLSGRSLWLAMLCAVGMNVVGRPLIGLLFGERYLAAIDLLLPISFYVVPVACLTILINYLMPLGRSGFFAVSMTAGYLLIFVLVSRFHHTVAQMLYIMGGGLLLVLAANLIYIALAPQKEKATV